jgi:hypothetical protein
VPLHAETRTPGIFGVTESRVGIAADRSEFHCEVSAGILEKERLVPI